MHKTARVRAFTERIYGTAYYGQTRGSLQKQGLYLPRERDLRRSREYVGLRSARRGVEKQRQTRVVEKIRTGKSAQYGR